MNCGWWFDSMENFLFLVLWKVWTHTAYEFIYNEFSMNSCIFCTLNTWIHTNMKSYHVWIHIFFAVIMYEFIYFLQCKKKAASARKPRACTASARKPRACTASAQRKLRGQSPSSPPAPTRPHPAAPTVRVAFGCPNQLGCVWLHRPVRVHLAAPIS